MKILKYFTLLSLSIVLFSSCSSKKTDDKSEEICIYQLDDKSLDFTWTAYKFTNKTGVNGTFNEISVKSIENPTSFEDMISNVEFSINTQSVFSNEPERDPKIAQFFFGTMANTSTITGAIKKVDGMNATLSLTINEMTLDVPGHIMMSGDTIKLHSEIDFKQFGAEEAVAMLNQVCSDQHKGEDGKSVFWDVVDINVKAVYKKDCK
ncbi:MAG: YceI family protein [Bacteroidota bacterium]